MNKIKKVIKYRSELKSYYCYPNLNTLDYIPTFVNNVQEERLRQVLSLICWSGYRVGEALNAFVFRNEGRWIIQAPMEKKKSFTKHIMNERSCLGKNVLDTELKTNHNLWKQDELKFKVFPEINRGWINDYITTDLEHPQWIFAGKDYKHRTKYKTIYKWLHEYEPYEIKYRTNPHQLFTTREYTPALHFFRKCFCAQACRKNTFGNIVGLTKALHWSKLDMAMYYVSDYGNNDEAAAVKLFDSSKFHYED